MQRSIKIGILALVSCLVLVGGWITHRSGSAYRQGLLYLGQHRWSAARKAMATASQFGEYANAMQRWQQEVMQYGNREASAARMAWDHAEWKRALAAIHQIPSAATTILAKAGWMMRATPLTLDPKQFIPPSISVQKITDVLFSPTIPAVVIEGVQANASGVYQDSATILTWNPQSKRYRVAYQLTRMASSSGLRYFAPTVAPVFGADNNAIVINDIEGQGGYSSGWAFKANPKRGKLVWCCMSPRGKALLMWSTTHCWRKDRPNPMGFNRPSAIHGMVMN